MKKLLLLSFLSIASAGQLFAQKGYHKSYNCSNFDAIDVGGAFEVKVKQSQKYSIEFVAEKENDIKDLDVTVSHGELKIGLDSDWSFWDIFGKSHGKIMVYITMPRLESLDISGASKLALYPFKNINDLDIDISGAAHAKLDIEADDVNVDASGASHLEIAGKVTRMDIEISGASHFSAKKAEVRNAQVDASGASHADFGKVANLRSETSGASHVSRN